jgi:outer membrane protein assembly factor BamB
MNMVMNTASEQGLASACNRHYRGLFGLLLVFVCLIAGCDSIEEGAHTSSNAQPPAETVPTAAEEADVPVLQNTIAFRMPTPLYAMPADESLDIRQQLRTHYYEGIGEQYPIRETQGEWCSLDSPYGVSWVPCWYGTSAVQTVTETAPALLHLTPDASLSLVPGSTAMWQPTSEEAVLSAYRWLEWHAVIVPSAAAGSESEPPLPLLLWVEAKHVASVAPIASGIGRSDASNELLRLSAEALLSLGTTQQRVLELLGEPAVREASQALNRTDEPLYVGSSWRYELADEQLTVTFDERALVREVRWTLPLADESLIARNGYRHPHRVYEYRMLPLVQSRAAETIWRTSGSLAYAYLLHATDDSLLLLGDDGGFSGMHYYSNLAGVDPRTGAIRWQIDTGYVGIDAEPTLDGEHVTVLTRIDRDAVEHVNRLRHVRMLDGEKIWEAELPEQREFVSLKSANGAVITFSQPFQHEAEGLLQVRSADAGKLLWERSFPEAYALLNQSSSDPYIYLLQADTLQALHPQTGKLAWSIRGLGVADPNDVHESPFLAPRTDPFGTGLNVRWLTLGADRWLVDMKSGAVHAKHRIVPGEIVEAIDNRHWFIQKPLDDWRYWMASEFETVLFDAMEGKSLWTLPGRAFGVVISDKSTLYATYNGLPTAIDRQSGRILWQSAGTGIASADVQAPSMLLALQDGPLLVMAGPDIIALDPKEGRALYRLQDAAVGYPETHGEYMRSHLAVQAPDGSFYLGSANGMFARLRLPPR